MYPVFVVEKVLVQKRWYYNGLELVASLCVG
jgi:hypothetical protein